MLYLLSPPPLRLSPFVKNVFFFLLTMPHFRGGASRMAAQEARQHGGRCPDNLLGFTLIKKINFFLYCLQEEAVMFGQTLVDVGLIHHVQDRTGFEVCRCGSMSIHCF